MLLEHFTVGILAHEPHSSNAVHGPTAVYPQHGPHSSREICGQQQCIVT